MIKCIIVEDERLAQQVIEAYIERTPQLQLIAICNNALEAKDVLLKQQVDLMFLDVQLPGMTGLNFLRTLQTMPYIILTTAYADYALESYEFNVVDYLLKSISFERFTKAIHKYLEINLPAETKTKSDHIYVKSSGRFIKINFADIMYVQGMKDYLKIVTVNSNIVTLQTMGEMEKILQSKQFIRVHKSYIVSLNHIKSIYGNNIEMAKASIPIGINYKEKITGLISGYFS
ncbi:LytR/AlgR family response regulator transcription factor [Parafilimonas terrae]|uniref:Two component transcriptional regulator, LytTR family n=1 Tax=Parafilimonas terrae TaxID=1465490 RepID=A0A1I5RWC4_9BACT|nr:LytTR family DNA-binding domain-containing protein [Parafilimonas terrae]SFP62815.1 two component transcriptional regulator, LytTR family [Parafilimonas terrae]